MRIIIGFEASNILLLINALTAISWIVVGGLLIETLVSPSEIDTTGPLPETEILHDLTVQAVKHMLQGRIDVESFLVKIASLCVITSAVLAWNAIGLLFCLLY